MRIISRLFMIIGIVLLGLFGFTTYDHYNSSSITLEEAEQMIIEQSDTFEEDYNPYDFNPEINETIGVLEIPTLNRSIGIKHGADDDILKQGVGHVDTTALPGQGEQIVLSGHRDTVFRDFGEIEIGDSFIVRMPYGDYEYKIYDSTIVDKNDTSIIKSMKEEVLVVSTCYPFEFYGFAPDRFVFYAKPK